MATITEIPRTIYQLAVDPLYHLYPLDGLPWPSEPAPIPPQATGKGGGMFGGSNESGGGGWFSSLRRPLKKRQRSGSTATIGSRIVRSAWDLTTIGRPMVSINHQLIYFLRQTIC